MNPPSSIKSSILSPFMALNIAQFCTTLNDNLFKLLLVFFLIALQGADHSYTILSLAGVIFVVPFILFAATSGTLADRYSKRRLIFITRGLEILASILGVLAFLLESPFLGYTVLFIFASESALFSPCKYGIIPEIVPSQKISYFNGLISATTYLAIIVGTFLASFLVQITHAQYVLASTAIVLIAVVGALASLGLPPTSPQAAKKKISFSVFGEILRILKRALQRRYLMQAIVFGAYFLFMAAYTQLNIIPFTVQSLFLPETMGGYIFLITALGIGLGSYCAGKLSGEEAEIGLVPLALIGASICFLALFMFHQHLYAVLFSLLFLGFFGGFYIVPIDIFIQVASPDKDRGQNVSAANFLSFAGVIASSSYLALMGNVLNLPAADGFGVIGIITFLLAIFLCLGFADQVVRLLLTFIGKIFWDLKVVGKRRLTNVTPVVIVGQRRSWLDILILMATLPRQVRYIVPTDAYTKRHPLYYRLFKVIPLDKSCYTPIGIGALEEIQKELSQGHSVCIMHPQDQGNLPMKEWREKVEHWLKDVEIQAIPIYITHEGSEASSHRWVQFFSLFGKKVTVGFGLPIY